MNGNETWMPQQDVQQTDRKICDTPDPTAATALDFDSLLNTFPGYIKTEYSYDDSGFSTDNKDDIILSIIPPQQQHLQLQDSQNQPQPLQSSGQTPILVSNVPDINNVLNSSFQNNNNDWNMANNNLHTEEDNVSLLLHKI